MYSKKHETEIFKFNPSDEKYVFCGWMERIENMVVLSDERSISVGSSTFHLIALGRFKLIAGLIIFVFLLSSITPAGAGDDQGVTYPPSS